MADGFAVGRGGRRSLPRSRGEDRGENTGGPAYGLPPSEPTAAPGGARSGRKCRRVVAARGGGLFTAAASAYTYFWRTGGLADWRTGGLADWRTGPLPACRIRQVPPRCRSSRQPCRRTPKDQVHRFTPAVMPTNADLSTLSRVRGASQQISSCSAGRDLAIFDAWCAERGLRALLACTETIAGIVDAMAATRAPATVRRGVASIGLAQRSSRAPGPGSDLPACPDPSVLFQKFLVTWSVV